MENAVGVGVVIGVAIGAAIKRSDTKPCAKRKAADLWMPQLADQAALRPKTQMLSAKSALSPCCDCAGSSFFESK